MTTHLALTRTSGAPLAGTIATGPAEAWDWIAAVVAKQFNCLPEDVGYDDGDVVTVGGEAVAVLKLTILGTSV